MSWQQTVSIVVFVVTMAAIITGKVNKAVATVFAAAILIDIGVVNVHTAFDAIDKEVLFLMVSMMLLVGILSKTGFFQWIALSLIKFSSGEPVRIMILIALGTAGLSAFLDNVTTVLLISPVVLLTCERLGVPAIPFLIVEVFAANVGGTATLIGDPPNMIIGSAAKLSFNDFIANTAPVVIVILLVGLVAIRFLFKRKFHVPREKRAAIKSIEPKSAIVAPLALEKSLIVFALVIVGFLIHDKLHITPAIVALTGASLLIIICRNVKFEEVVNEIDWATIFFLVGLFMVVSGMEHAGVMHGAAKVLFRLSGGKPLGAMMSILWFSGAIVGVLTSASVAAMVPIVKELVAFVASHSGIPQALLWKPFFWSLSLGACLGGNSTIFGTTATIVMIGFIERTLNVKISFVKFMKYGVPTVLVSLAISSIYIILRYAIPLANYSPH